MPDLVELTAAPPSGTPGSIDPGAWPAFEAMTEACGRTAFRTPSSCQLFLKQYLRAYPAERDLLSKALDRGVPAAVAEIPAGGATGPALGKLSRDFAAATGTPPDQAAWAVNAWAAAVGKPATVTARPVATSAPRVVGATAERLIMAGVVSLGGALGGAIGNAGELLTNIFSRIAITARFSEAAADREQTRSEPLLYAIMVLGAASGAGAAFAGWWLGRGDRRPWAGFSVAFGTALTAGGVVYAAVGWESPFLALRYSGIFGAIGIGFAVLGAVYTCSVGGGQTAYPTGDQARRATTL